MMIKSKYRPNYLSAYLRMPLRICSLLLAGRSRSAFRLVKILKYKIFENIYFLDFKSHPAFGTKYKGYWNSTAPDLERVLNRQNITLKDSILDIGCGKGGAILTMTNYPFKTIDGLEIDETYISIARRNLNRMGKNDCQVFHADAINFSRLQNYNYFYFFDPFSCDVMQKVVENLIKSLDEFPRKIKIIYNQPSCHNTILDSKRFRMIESYEHFEEGLSLININVYESITNSSDHREPASYKLWD